MRIEPIGQSGVQAGLGANAQTTAAVAGDAVFADQLRQAESAAKLKGQSGDEAKLKPLAEAR